MLFFRILSFFFILIFFPIFIIFFILVFFYDFSSPIYFGSRVGKNYKFFYQFKFRSMTNKKIGFKNRTSTSKKDPRITPIGSFIRRIKIDELPQLFNVLWGHMSLVGPRPQVLNAVKKYYNKEKQLLSVKPGITDFASIVFADEGEILSDSVDPDLCYDNKIDIGKVL